MMSDYRLLEEVSDLHSGLQSARRRLEAEDKRACPPTPSRGKKGCQELLNKAARARVHLKFMPTGLNPSLTTFILQCVHTCQRAVSTPRGYWRFKLSPAVLVRVPTPRAEPCNGKSYWLLTNLRNEGFLLTVHEPALPAGMQRHKTNTSYFSRRDQCIYWHLEIRFPLVQVTVHLERVQASTTIQQVSFQLKTAAA